MSVEQQQMLSPESGVALVEFARGCKAAVRAVSLYPGQHPAIAASLTRLVQATGRLTLTGPLQLQVRPDTLLIGDAMLAKPDQGVKELAELLHRHLIGALTINAGADADSWRTLLLLLSRAPEDVRADGGIAHLWATAGGPSVEIKEIDYAEVLREKKGDAATIDSIIAAALAGTPLQLDDEGLAALLAILSDPAQVDELMARLDEAAKDQGTDAKTAAIMNLLKEVVAQAKKGDAQQFEAALNHLGHLASRLSADEMVHLLTERSNSTPNGEIAAAVLQRMDDADVAQFVARSVVAEDGATGRLAHAFTALVPDADKQRQLMSLAQEQAAAQVGEGASFDELWERVESMVTSYSDENFVSGAYGRELSAAQT